jgi:hypothetical protein
MANLHESYVLLPILGKEIAINDANGAQRSCTGCPDDVQLTLEGPFRSTFQQLQFVRTQIETS